MSKIPSFTLNTGAKIPALALGTFQAPNKEAYDSVLHAIKFGYRHIDTAWIYKNEEAVGKAIRDSGVPREDIFVTTKLWNTDFRDPAKALDISLKLLGLDYVDLYLVHWPVALKAGPTEEVDHSVSFIDAWVKLQELPKSKVKAIGVSNLDVFNLKKLLDDKRVTVVPAANQVELHVNLAQPKLLEFSKAKGIITEAYSPLAQGQLDNAVVKRLAEKYNATPANIVLSWGIQRDTVVLPKSVKNERIEGNFKYIKLDQADFDAIEKISVTEPKRINDPWPQENIFHDEADSK